MTGPASYQKIEHTPDGLIAGPMPLAARRVTLLAGENLQRGAVLGKITASGKYRLAAADAEDGSATPDAILAQDCDATAGDQEALIYTRGDFAERALTFGGGHTAATVRETLRTKGIHLIATQEA